MKRYLLVILFTGISTLSFSHKFYVSICDLEYNVEKDRIEGSLKLTAHDFEKILSEKFNRKIFLDEVHDTSEVGKYIQVYLNQHFKIKSNGKLAKPVYFGKEVTLEQDLYIYFTFTEIENPAQIEIHNSILIQPFIEQQNIVHYQYKEQTKTITLVATKVHEKIIFDE